MSQTTDAAMPVARPLRADAQRNRDELLRRATEVFTERGTEASLEEIARRAGVGIGTLYRHFPSRDVLIEAAYRQEVETLCDGVDELLAHHPADEALALWMRSFAVYVVHKRGMATALKSLLGVDSPLFVQSHDRIRGAIGKLLDAAARSGAVRDDIAPDDLLRAMGGICMAADTADPSGRTDRLIGLLIDGLRYGAPGAGRS